MVENSKKQIISRNTLLTTPQIIADLNANFFVVAPCFRNGCLNTSGIKRQPIPSGFHEAVFILRKGKGEKRRKKKI